MRVFVAALAVVFLISFSVLPAFAAEPDKKPVTAGKQDVQKPGAHVESKGCGALKATECAAVVTPGIEACADTYGATCLVALWAVKEDKCCPCLPWKLKDLCNKATHP